MDLSMVEVFQSIVIIILIEAQIILFLANGILFKLVPESFFLFFFFWHNPISLQFLALWYDKICQVRLVFFLPQIFNQKILRIPGFFY